MKTLNILLLVVFAVFALSESCFSQNNIGSGDALVLAFASVSAIGGVIIYLTSRLLNGLSAIAHWVLQLATACWNRIF